MASLGNLVLTLQANTQPMSRELERAQKSLANTTSALQREVDTFGMSRKEIELYDAAKKGANQAQLQQIAALHDEVEAKKAVARATEEARKNQESLTESTKALKKEAETYGMSRKEASLYEASKKGATQAQLSEVAALHDEINTKKAAAKAAEEARKNQDSLVSSTKALKRESETYGMSRKEIALYDAAKKGATKTQLSEIAALHDEIDAKKSAAKATELAREKQERFRQSLKGGVKQLGLASVKMAAYATAAAAAAGVSLGAYAVKLAADAEQTRVAFETMLGSAELAKKTIGSLKDFTASTPFGETEVLGAAKALIAFGSEAGGVTDELRMLGDIGSGVGVPLGELAEIYGKARTQGRLFAEDINQLTGRGIPIIQGLADVMGVTQGEVKKLVEEGQIGFPEMQTAFANMTSEGGRFFGMTEKQSQTLAGQWSTLKDNVTAALTEIGTAIMEEFDLKAVTGNLTEFVKEFKSDWMPAIREGISDAASTAQQIWDVFKGIGAAIEPVITKLMEMNAALDRMVGNSDGLAKKFGAGGSLADQFARRGLYTPKPATPEAPKIPADRFAYLRKQGPEIPAELLKQRDEMTSEAKKLAESMKTPAEQFQDEIARLTNLFEGGYISSQLFDRAAQSAMDQLPDNQQEQGRSQIRSLEAGSQEAFESMMATIGVGKPQEKQLKESQKTNKILTDILKETKKTESSTIEEKGFD